MNTLNLLSKIQGATSSCNAVPCYRAGDTTFLHGRVRRRRLRNALQWLSLCMHSLFFNRRLDPTAEDNT